MFIQLDWFPEWLGGSKGCVNIYNEFPNYPNDPTNGWLSIYYLVQFATHSYSMFELLIKSSSIEKKFWEYLLHHFLASSLIFFSLM